MSATEPEIPDNGRYSATEVCKILGIHRNTLRNYAENATIKFGIRKSNGRKFFTGYEIKKFWRTQY